MFPTYPGSSPSSYRKDDSFLQRAALEGFTSLSQVQPPFDPSQLLPTDMTADGSARVGRPPYMGPALRIPSASAHSQRLSPTLEVESPPDSDGEFGDGAEEYEGPPQMPKRMPSFQAVRPPPSGSSSSETTPLLVRSTSAMTIPPVPADTTGPTAMRQEVGVLLGYMLPICGTHFLEYSLLVVTVVSVGHIGTVELAAASLSSMTSNVVALSVIQGFCTALDTLCPQAYTSNPKTTSLYALRTFYLLVLLIIPQVIIFWNIEPILLLLRQDPRVAERASVYLRVLAFGLPGYAGFECVRRWLQAQGLMLAPAITLIVAAPLNVVLNYLLVWGPESIRLGFVGAPLATAIAMNTMFIVSIVYAIHAAPRDAWGGLTWAIFHDLGINIRLGLAGTAMVASEWWCWEIVGLASSFLGPTTLAAQSILLTSASLFYQLPYSLSVAGAVRVGNLLGGQRPKRARTASRATMGIAICVAGVNSALLIIFRRTWGGLFSSEADVIELVAGVLPLVALFQLADGMSGATGGLLRGAGRATLGALINLASYYVIGLPIGLLCAFVWPKWGLLGLWVGLTVALAFTAVIMSIFIWRMDWELECQKTVDRMGLVKRDGAEEA